MGWLLIGNGKVIDSQWEGEGERKEWTRMGERLEGKRRGERLEERGISE